MLWFTKYQSLLRERLLLFLHEIYIILDFMSWRQSPRFVMLHDYMEHFTTLQILYSLLKSMFMFNIGESL